VVHVTVTAVAVLGGVVAIVLARAARRAPVAGRLRRLRPQARLPLPAPVRARLAGALARADVDLTPDDAVRTWLLAVLVAALLAGALGAAFGIAAAITVLAGGPVALWWARGRADERVVGALPGALDRVAAGLRAGGTVPDGIAGLATAAGPLAPDLVRVDARCRLGAALTDALAQWSRERPRPEIGAVSGALALAVTAGGASAAALEGLGESLRSREATRREARALTAQTRLSAWVVGAAPVAYLAFASLADPATFDTLLATNAGRACLAAGLALEALAALWMRALLRSEA
jgi:tight adherence protein B